MKIIRINYHQQRGAVAIIIAAILLFAATLVVLYAAKIGVEDQRISGNDYRAKKAFANAEAGLEAVAANLLTGNVAYTTTTNFPNSTAEPYYNADLTLSGDGYQIASQGYAETFNDQSTASVRQKFGYYNIFDAGPDVPLMIAGNVPPTGNMEVVGNPNGAGTGVNVAVWTSEVVALSGSPSTCQRAEYEANGNEEPSSTGNFNICSANSCACTGTIDGIISKSGIIGSDIVAEDPSFPDDVFGYVFGLPTSEYQTIKNIAAKAQPTQVVTNCNGLKPNSHGIWWVTGNCDLPGNDVGGANTCGASGNELCAVVVVVDNGALKKTGGDNKFYGLLFMFDNPDIPGFGTADMKGSTSLYGAFIADNAVCPNASCITGSFDLVYEKAVFEAIANDDSNRLLSRVAGTWIDQ